MIKRRDDCKNIVSQKSGGVFDTLYELHGPLKEKDGREDFLMFLKPIINGTGNYYIKAETGDQTRTDIVVDYLGQQYIIELKNCRGERYNAVGGKFLMF